MYFDPLQPTASVRTRYDRMFQRKNQGILSEPYRKLVDHSSASSAEEEDFITLQRADHDASPISGPSSMSPMQLDKEDMSRRKMKLGKAKRAVAKYGAMGKKLVFDEDGRAHELYELADADKIYKEKGAKTVMEEGEKFAEGERVRMRQADTVDKQEAKEKKRSKKRKRKEQEIGVSILRFCHATCLKTASSLRQ
jgi:ATP-dependent RNA helicase DDX10/DBP4